MAGGCCAYEISGPGWIILLVPFPCYVLRSGNERINHFSIPVEQKNLKRYLRGLQGDLFFNTPHDFFCFWQSSLDFAGSKSCDFALVPLIKDPHCPPSLLNSIRFSYFARVR